MPGNGLVYCVWIDWTRAVTSSAVSGSARWCSFCRIGILPRHSIERCVMGISICLGCPKSVRTPQSSWATVGYIHPNQVDVERDPYLITTWKTNKTSKDGGKQKGEP